MSVRLPPGKHLGPESALAHLLALGLAGADGAVRTDDFTRFAQVFSESRQDLSVSNQPVMTDLVRALVLWPEDEDRLVERLGLHVQAAEYCERMGTYEEGVLVGQVGLDLAVKHHFPDLERRLASALGNLFMGASYFDEACSTYVRVMDLANKQGDAFLQSAALANIASLMFKMGCDRDVIDVADRGLALRPEWPHSTPAYEARNEHVAFSLANNALGSAARLRDERAGLRFMAIAAPFYDAVLLSDTSRAQFELNRAQFLVGSDDLESADTLLTAAMVRLDVIPDANPRVQILMALAQARCDWASQEEARIESSYRALSALLSTSQQVKSYHAAFLEELIALHRAAGSTDFVGQGYVDKLVDHRTSVKYAELKRHIARRQEIWNDAKADRSQGVVGRQAVEPVFPIVGGHAYMASLIGGAAARATSDEKRAETMARMRTAAYSTAESWAVSAEFFQDPTAQHIFRVGRLAGMLATEIGMDSEQCVRIELAGRLHDIGKTTVSDAILMKPGLLSAGEMKAAQAHAVAGHFLLKQSDDPTLKLAAVICRSHHEWWNGTGYPDRAIGDAIPIEARIVALADVYDALLSERPYKGAWTHRAAVEQIMTESGTHHDPQLARAFLKVLERYVAGDRADQQSDFEANDLLRSRRQLLSSIDRVAPR